MKDILKLGLKETLEFRVTIEKTVPALYPESAEFQAIPEVFATGYMIGLMEWCCINALKPALDDGEGSLGTLIEVTHSAATPVGALVKVEAILESVNHRRFIWNVTAYDNLDAIGRGRIGRTVVEWCRFEEKLEEKTEKIRFLEAQRAETR